MVSTWQAWYKNRTKIIKFLKTLPHSPRKILQIYVCLSVHLSAHLIPGLVKNHYFVLNFWKMILMQNKRELVIYTTFFRKIGVCLKWSKNKSFFCFRKTVFLFFLDLVYNENLYYLISQLKSHTYLVNFWFLSFGLKCSWSIRWQFS